MADRNVTEVLQYGGEDAATLVSYLAKKSGDAGNKFKAADGEDDDDVVTMGQIQSGSNSNGSWTKLPDGTIIQRINNLRWGTQDKSTSKEVDWVLPIPFTTDDYFVSWSVGAYENGGGADSNHKLVENGLYFSKLYTDHVPLSSYAYQYDITDDVGLSVIAIGK